MQFIWNFEKKGVDEITTKTTYDYDSYSVTARNLSKGTQTDYRDSEAQTDPWEPPYKITPGSQPDILALADLTWANGLPAGENELKIVKRMIIKNAWASVLPPLDSEVNVQVHKTIISIIDKDEWAFRNKELQTAMDAKLEGMNKMIKLKNSEQKMKLMVRFEKVGQYLNQFKSKEINQIKRQLNRDLRKLSVKYRENKYFQWNKKNVESVTKKSTEIKKDFYLFKCKLDNQSFYDALLNENFFNGDKKLSLTQGNNLSRMSHLKSSSVNKRPLDELCLRETRWTEDKLKKLYSDLKNIRLNTSRKTDGL